MASHSRNLLLFIVLSGIAALTWLLSREPLQQAARETGQTPAPQGYYLVDAVLLGTNDDGRIYYRVNAGRVEQRADGEDYVLTDMSVRYDPESNIRWELTAANGYMPRDRSWFDLEDVRLVYTPEEGEEGVTIETAEMRLDAGELLASTSRPVVFRHGRAVTSAIGLKVDLEAETYELESDVRTHFSP